VSLELPPNMPILKSKQTATVELAKDQLASEDTGASAETVTEPSVIATRMVFAASPARVWQSLLFYEEVEQRPPLHLRLLLPVPIGVEGDKSRTGGEARCLYQDGHLVKRLTRIEETRLCEFEVAEQKLAVGGAIRLCGGRYSLREVGVDLTEVTVGTKYTSSKAPRWFWQPLERFVCHMFHRFLLRQIRRKAEQA
jgi:hypothetical protein